VVNPTDDTRFCGVTRQRALELLHNKIVPLGQVRGTYEEQEWLQVLYLAEQDIAYREQQPEEERVHLTPTVQRTDQ